MPRKSPTSDPALNFYEQYKAFIVPSLIGGLIAWFFSDSFKLGVMVFFAVWIGNWVGSTLLKKK